MSIVNEIVFNFYYIKKIKLHLLDGDGDKNTECRDFRSRVKLILIKNAKNGLDGKSIIICGLKIR